MFVKTQIPKTNADILGQDFQGERPGNLYIRVPSKSHPQGSLGHNTTSRLWQRLAAVPR